MSGSGSGSSSSGHPFPRPSSRTGRARCQSTVGASDSPPAPSGRERLAINFLTSGGPPQPRFPPLQQGYTRVRSTSTADVSQARRHFVPTPSHLNPGQPRVATASGSAEDSGRTYHLEVIQHPETGAEFGSATLSRLPLSPPLIVQLTVRDRSGTPVRADAELPFLVAHLSLTTSDGATTLDFVNNPSARGGAALPQQLLYGTLVSSPHNYRTLQGAWGHHFLFPDVSVRRRGQYRLRIMLMRLDRLLPSGNPNTGEGVLAAALTNPFNILPHQNFVAPPPTALTQYLAQQGARMFTFASSPPSRQFIH